MWSNAQKLMADSWSVAAEPLARAHEDKVRVWESWVNNALAQQREWSQTVTARAADWPGLPTPVGTLIEHTQAANGRLLALQGELWSRWFGLLRRSPQQAANEAAPLEAPAAVVETLPADSPPSQALEFEAEDDLTAIAGVGPAIAGKLRAAGVNTYRAIAAWNEADMTRIEDSVLGGRFAGRIRRDDWLDQARWLHAEKYGRAV
jgi:predicted flap endonuclease-1-like 5' DNA nuclease